MARFDFIPTALAGLVLVERKPLEDDRGFLARLWCADEFAGAGWKRPILQVNQTLTRRRGSVRGMHFQHPPHAEMKLVSCLQGEVFDVAVDLRKGSPSYLRWFGATLSASNRRSLLIPEGFAHGFQALSDNCELLYLHSATHHPDAEGAINATDPRIGILWPLPIGERSPRDQGHPLLDAGYEGMDI